MPYRTAITVLLFTGMRRGELLGLKWPDIRFENSTICIDRTLLYLPNKGLFEDDTKTTGSRRVIKAPQSAMLALQAYQAWQTRQRMQLGSAWGDSPYVFTSLEGQTMRPDTLTNWFHSFIQRTDLPPIHLHSLRHTFASNLVNGIKQEDGSIKSLTPRQVADLLGHSTSQITELYYVKKDTSRLHGITDGFNL